VSVTKAQREAIRELAGNCCEYCRVREDGLLALFQIDHIIPVKHGGMDDDENLCLACLKCNGYKGPNVAALDPETGDATKLYNPRQQIWDEHFAVNDDATLRGLSPEGRATILVLRINEESRVQTRQLMLKVGRFPC
jgi:hypothetical protein